MKYLLFFPEPYPDEDFRSIIYRYHLRSGNSDFSETKDELFGVKSHIFGVFPRNLSFLLKKLPFAIDIEKSILLNTWLPLFLPFLSKSRRLLVENEILYGRINDGGSYVGKVHLAKNFQIFSNTIKYCPVCMEEDYVRVGECYVHLQHQLFFINFCSKHFVELTDKCIRCNKKLSTKGAGYLNTKPCCSNGYYRKVPNNEITQFKTLLLIDLNYIRLNGLSLNNELIYGKMINLLGVKGYIYNNGIINKRKLLDDMVKHYGLEALQSVGVKDKNVISMCAIPRFLKQGEMSSLCLLYILVMRFLAGSVESFLNYEAYYSITIPFGNGPWPCYNKSCSSFERTNPIIKCIRKLKKGSFKGTFACPICGFTYVRKWITRPLSKNAITDEHIEIKDMGFMWRQKVEELKNKGYTYKEIALMFELSESTLRYRRKAPDIKKEDKNIVYKETLKIEKKNVKREICREKIISILKENNKLNRTNTYSKAKKEFKWLLRNDNEWLEHTIPPRSTKKIIDFSKLDKELEIKVKRAVEVVYKSNPPSRIKMHSILNKLEKIDKYRFLKNQEFLSKTRNELESSIEKIEDYQVRHIPSIVAQLRASGYKNVTVNSILSFRRTYRNCTEETKRRIQNILDTIQS